MPHPSRCSRRVRIFASRSNRQRPQQQSGATRALWAIDSADRVILSYCIYVTSMGDYSLDAYTVLPCAPSAGGRGMRSGEWVTVACTLVAAGLAFYVRGGIAAGIAVALGAVILAVVAVTGHRSRLVSRCQRVVADGLAKRRILGATLDELCVWLPTFSRDELYSALCYWEREGKARRENQGRWVWGSPSEPSERFRSRLF